MKLIIDRDRWARGNFRGKIKSEEVICLRHSFNKSMCCLGFYALQCGYSEEEIDLHPLMVEARDFLYEATK